MYVVSGCLLGYNCKYNGGNNLNEDVVEFCRNRQVCVVCPETSGGLESPRPPAERQGDRIVDREGKDLTQSFLKGAELSWDKVRKMAADTGETVEGAILKANSPSCGSGQIYDGSFTGKKVAGYGCFAKILKDNGINVISEKEIEK